MDSICGLELVEWEGAKFLVAGGLLEKGITVAFTSRVGGVSERPYDSLNIAFHVGDDAERVAENRERACRALDIDPDGLIFAEQVHGSEVAVVGNAERGCGSHTGQTAIAGVDALVTDQPRTPLAVQTADCVPIALVDQVTRVISVVHAGWRGTIAGIAGKAIERMVSLGSSPQKILAFIGPSIGPCCYEVDGELGGRFREEFGEAVAPDGRHVDLIAVNDIQLVKAGVEPSSISGAGLCTSCRNDLFFSYRADGGETGRQMLLAASAE